MTNKEESIRPNFLLENESVLWEWSPSHVPGTGKRDMFKDLMTRIVWLIGTGAAFVAVCAHAYHKNISGLEAVLFAALGIVTGLATIVQLFKFGYHDRPPRSAANETYTLTDRRLVIQAANKSECHVLPGRVFEIQKRQRGGNYDILLGVFEDVYRVLWNVKNPDPAIKTLMGVLCPSKTES